MSVQQPSVSLPSSVMHQLGNFQIVESELAQQFDKITNILRVLSSKVKESANEANGSVVNYENSTTVDLAPMMSSQLSMANRFYELGLFDSAEDNYHSYINLCIHNLKNSKHISVKEKIKKLTHIAVFATGYRCFAGEVTKIYAKRVQERDFEHLPYSNAMNFYTKATKMHATVIEIGEALVKSLEEAEKKTEAASALSLLIEPSQK
ncbi:MAG: hypothetical protein KR126chlam6_00199 [Candidatus Anoxychlamydiales bacterium]|nr:hypothetical protein [Candidatus Anoxychlamydiales bacterium]